MFALAIVNLQAQCAALAQRVAVLEVLAAEQARRDPMARPVDLVACDEARYALALADVCARAAQTQITALDPPGPDAILAQCD